ncbi:MAG: anaerobic glycerol-3-phosphate dehydrogenase subunit C [Calditrichaeota bacterium]|nr:MAG: anaerobic glycerol-3-phosphate dehydrogenase subunit C [Calditrichota bacterium]
MLRAVLSGRLPLQKLTSSDVYRVMDLCLACKGCKGECPTNVDMAKLKYEFLYQYHKKHRLPLRDRLFGHIETVSRLGCATAPVSNMVLAASPVRWGMEKVLGIDRRRRLPRFASEPFTRWFARHLPAPDAGRRGRVVLFHDTFMTYNYPEVGVAAVRLLEAAGYEVHLVEKRCCGRPFLSKGMLAHARRCAQHNLGALLPWVEQGVPVVGCEPSCILTFRDEYPDLLSDDAVGKLAENSFLFEEFFARDENGAGLAFRKTEHKLLLHGHCHMKALAGLEPTLRLLSRLPGAEVQALDSGCCGMAGAFGFEKEHYELSLKIGRGRLFPAIDEKDTTWRVVAPGVSCRQQIEHATGRRAWHPVEVLAEALVVNGQNQG